MTRAALVRHLRERFLPSDEDRSRWVWAVQAGSRVEAIAALELLPWDSELYGTRIARLEAVAASLRVSDQCAAATAWLAEVGRTCRDQGIAHVAARVGVGDFGVAQALEEAECRYTDTTVTLTRESDQPCQDAGPTVVRVVCEEDIAVLQRIAADAFTSGRVAHDPRFPAARNRELYRRWIANACRGRSEIVLVAITHGAPVGFACCSVDDKASRHLDTTVGFIDLLAVAPRMQGKGLGRALLRGAVARLSPRAQLVEIRTQLSNTVSLSLYQREGFRIVSPGIALPSGHVFHGWFS